MDGTFTCGAGRTRSGVPAGGVGVAVGAVGLELEIRRRRSSVHPDAADSEALLSDFAGSRPDAAIGGVRLPVRWDFGDAAPALSTRPPLARGVVTPARVRRGWFLGVVIGAARPATVPAGSSVVPPPAMMRMRSGLKSGFVRRLSFRRLSTVAVARQTSPTLGGYVAKLGGGRRRRPSFQLLAASIERLARAEPIGEALGNGRRRSAALLIVQFP